jgi:hypothetical protein
VSDVTDLKNRFGYHGPDEVAKERHRTIRRMIFTLADELDDFIPEGREKSLFFTKLEEAMMWANAAIARKGPLTEDPST